jgi:nucleoside-diphosphate-sugar epimerase
MNKTLFVTGSTGFVGKHFLRELFATCPDVSVYALARPDTIERISLSDDILDVYGDPRLTFVPGDVTNPDVVMDGFLLPQKIDEFWHIAGVTDFNEEKRQRIFSINVDGARNVLNLADRIKPGRFFHISTAYVAGIHNDIAYEDELLPNPVFRNPYEESKYCSENMVRNSTIPWTILRPSIVMGHSETGEVENDKTTYGYAKIYHLLKLLIEREWRDRGGIPSDLRYSVRGKSGATKDVVMVDDIARMMVAIRQQGELGKTYNMTASRQTNVGEITDTILSKLETDIIALTEDHSKSGDRFQSFLNRNMTIYEPYMMYDDPVFDRSNLLGLTKTDPVKPIGYPELTFLFGDYIDKREQERKTTAGDEKHAGSLDLSRLEMVKQWGSFSLAYETMAKQYQQFTVDGINGYLAYVLHEGTALMVADPVSDTPERLAEAFIPFCLAHGHSPCAAQISEPTATALRNAGLAVNGFGLETFIVLNRIDPELKGKKYEIIRNSRNIAQRYGITVKEEPLSSMNRAALEAISTCWKGGKKNKEELRVLLRPVSFEAEPGVRTFFLRQGKKLLGYIFYSPIYRQGKVIGYYSNVERFIAGSQEIPKKFNFVKHVNFEATLTFRNEGVEFISLGLSPLYDLERATWNDNTELKELFEKLYSESELYAFQGIAEHKRRVPDIDEHTVYFAAQPGTTGEDMLHILSAVGLLG